MGKLTASQWRLLGALADGATILRIGGFMPMQWLSTTGKHINWSTTTILLRNGLIEQFNEHDHQLDPDYRINDAGRLALSLTEEET